MNNKIDIINGGFPRIQLCDIEFVNKLLEKKPREFSNTNIISIKDILANKKKNNINNIISEPNIFIDRNIEYLNIINTDSEKINNININVFTKNRIKKIKKIKK